MAVVVFNFDEWLAQYPEFAGRISQQQATAFFNRAGLVYLPNTDASPVPDVTRRQVLLYLLVAHLAQLHCPPTPGGASTGLVGRVTNASEGSVSVGVDMGPVDANSAWWYQTAYGAEYWQLMAPLRQGRYYPGPPVRVGFGVSRQYRR